MAGKRRPAAQRTTQGGRVVRTRRTATKKRLKIEGRLRAGSYSTLHGYEKKCPRRIFYSKVARVGADPLGPAAARGNEIHASFYEYLTAPRFPKQVRSELESLVDEMKEFRRMPRREMEGAWAVDRNWRTVDWRDWDNVWVRCKADAFGISRNGKSARTIDLKTGKSYPNHVEQVELQAVFAMHREPKLEVVSCELWYSDSGQIVDYDVSRDELESLTAAWAERFERLTSEVRWPARPSADCAFCPFSKEKGGPCRY